MIVEKTVYSDGDVIEEPKKTTRVLMSPYTAAVGQYLRIAEVSENGMVKKLVSVDDAGGGGAPGASAYEIALRHGFEGSEEDWLDSLQGPMGPAPVKGLDYYTPEEKAELIEKIEVAANSPVNKIAIAEESDGTITMVTTLEDGKNERIVITADANGNPNKLTYNGMEIPLSWAVIG
jgi:hypothetical protein